MKPRRIDLDELYGPDTIMRRVAIVRFAEVLGLAQALRHARAAELHDLRIACKRLRFALERFSTFEPSLHEAVIRLAQLQDALGDIHDRDVLMELLPKSARNTAHRLEVQREDAVTRARALWHDAFATFGPFAGLVHFTGLGHGVGEAFGTTLV